MSFNCNGYNTEYHILDKLLDFDKRIGKYGCGLWLYTPNEYQNESEVHQMNIKTKAKYTKWISKRKRSD